MIVGSVASGVMMGLVGAIMTWAGGHPMVAVLLAYSVIGSLGTLSVAAMTMGSAGRAGGLLR